MQLTPDDREIISLAERADYHLYQLQGLFEDGEPIRGLRALLQALVQDYFNQEMASSWLSKLLPPYADVGIRWVTKED